MANATKRLLAESLKKMLERRTLDKITVKELVADCGVNRQTFYYNFRDIYDLMDWIFQEEEKRLVGENAESASWKDRLEAVFQYLQDDRNRHVVQNACQSMSRQALSRYLKKRLRPIVEEQVNSQSGDLRISDERKEFVADAFSIMMTGVILDWLDNGMQRDQHKQVDLLTRLVDGSMRYALEKLAE